MTVTTKVAVLVQPVKSAGKVVYDIVSRPADTPATVTILAIARIVAEPLDAVQLPPKVPSVREMVLPTHTALEPVIAATVGRALMVTVALPWVQPQALSALK